ncbi:LOW QUALITY PROTEIN: V-type proton ATPase subunit S1-like [Leptosomus discolor]
MPQGAGLVAAGGGAKAAGQGAWPGLAAAAGRVGGGSGAWPARGGGRWPRSGCAKMAAAAALRDWAWAWAWALGLSLALGPGGPGGGSALWPPPAEGAGGRVVGEEQLRALLPPALRHGPSTVLLFLQEKLSVEDFTAYGGVYGNKPDSAFPNLEGALGGGGSALVLPAVAGGAAEALPHTLARALGAAPLRVDGAALRQLRLNASLPALLLVRLPHAAGSSLMAPKEVLTSNDEILGQVLSALKEEEVPYTALFTALRPSRVLREAGGAPAVGPGRALLGQERRPGGPRRASPGVPGGVPEFLDVGGDHWGSPKLSPQRVQAFNVSGGSFGGASDCAAFFSPGAWMGLLTGGLLLGGLLYGGGQLLRLRTMDRFDDPRGPPLPVPLGD